MQTPNDLLLDSQIDQNLQTMSSFNDGFDIDEFVSETLHRQGFESSSGELNRIEIDPSTKLYDDKNFISELNL